MAFFLSLCLPLVVQIWRQHQEAVADTGSAEAPAEPGPRNLRESIGLVFSSTHLRAIAALICVSSFVTEVIDWQFKAVAKEFIPVKDHLAAFFGDFTFYAGILTLVVQVLVTSRVLRRFGIGVGLVTLPVALLANSTYMLLTGTLSSAVLLRGSDWVGRHSIDKSSVELLYLPLPSRLKLQVKWFIDTVIWRMGSGLAAVTVLFFVTYLRLTARQMSWIGLVLVGGWLAAAWVARQQYVVTLTEGMREHRLEAKHAVIPVLERSIIEVLDANLSASDPNEVLYALSVLETDQQASNPPIRVLLNHPAAEVRKKAITVLDAGGDKTVVPQIEVLLQDPSLDVGTAALLYLAHHAHVVAAAKAILDKGTIPDQAQFFPYLKGYVAFYAGDYKTALAELSKANQNDPFIQCMIGQTYDKLGDKDKALEYYRKASRAISHNPAAAYAVPFAKKKLS